jgi:BON domain
MRTSTRLVVTAALLALLAGCGNSRPTDATITQEIQSKLFSSAQTKSASLRVSTNGGVVTLSGSVPSDAARYEAYKIATETNGVTTVDDQITVAAAESQPEPTPVVAPAPKPARTEPARPRTPPRETVAAATPQPAVPPPAPEPVAAVQPPAPPPFVQPTPPPPPPAPVMRTVEVPAGTVVQVRTIDAVDSAVNKAGELFRASLAAPIVIRNEVVVPAGTDVDLRLVDASSAGRIKGRSGLVLQLGRLDYQGQRYELVSNDYEQQGASEGRRTAGTIGGGAAVGAIIGGILGGGKGAAIGAGTGAGAGTVASAVTKAQQVQIPAETKLDFTLEQPVSVTYNPERNRTTR